MKRIDNSSQNNWQNCKGLWALSAHLQKDREVVFQEKEDLPIWILTGVPQGRSWALFSSIYSGLHSTETSSDFRALVDQEKALVYAIDLMITTEQVKNHKIKGFIEYFAMHCLKTNPDKELYNWGERRMKKL